MSALVTLNFHGLGTTARQLEAGEREVWLEREAFESHLDVAASRDDVKLTFDDSNASDVELALPALRRRGLTASFFIVAGRLGQAGFLGADDLRKLVAAGMTIGSHGMEHRPWRHLDDAALDTELVTARELLEEVVKQPVTEAACPFGSYDRRVLDALRSRGYRRVYTSDGGLERPGAWLQPRNTVGRSDRPDLIAEITARRRNPGQVLLRRAKLAVKRWR